MVAAMEAAMAGELGLRPRRVPADRSLIWHLPEAENEERH
jgi:hypothetical protein